MKKNNFIPLLFAGLELMTACTDSSSSFETSEVCPESGRGTFQDVRDGQVYKYITIGDRVWMDQNLNYPAETSTCYDEQQSKCDIYGRLYSVQYMNTKQNNYGTFNPDIIDSICPNGWRVPTLAEWNRIVDLMDGIKYFKNNECMEVSLYSGYATFYNSITTGEPEPLLYEDLGKGFRIWLTSTFSEYGNMKVFSPDFEDRVNGLLVDKPKGYYSLRCIKKEDWEL
jgi:uncharacterized protein (TIGR02145 family)